MRQIPFHILFACIFLPPVLYLLSLQTLETVVEKRWASELQGKLISDSKALLEGSTRIEDEIRRNVDTFLSVRRALKWGFHVQVIVKTEKGTQIYPSLGKDSLDIFKSKIFPQEKLVRTPSEMLRVAENNLKLMDEGLALFLSAQLPRDSLPAYLILAFFIVIFTALLYRYYLLSIRESRQMEIRNQQALHDANQTLMAAQDRLRDVTTRESDYQSEIERLKADLDLADDKVRETEDEALSEMERLERKLNDSIGLKEKLELEVLRLGEELEGIESAQKLPAKKLRKKVDRVSKRFKTLYKKLEIQTKAIEGFLNLEADLQLRAEELIHSMNEDISLLPVKRKVFSKKGTTPTFECEFGYRGRIYWRPGTHSKTQVLVIGTKNTQEKDLAYLENN